MSLRRPLQALSASPALCLAAVLCAASGGLGCGAIATSPAWTGGGMAVTGPIRMAKRDAEAAAERERLASQPKKIGARHILIMHVGSKTRPEEVTRTREEALKRAQDCLLEVRSGANFSKMVAKYSDEPGAAERGGDLGVFKREVMVKAFSDAAFELKKGEISEVVESPYGFHIIKRTR